MKVKFSRRGSNYRVFKIFWYLGLPLYYALGTALLGLILIGIQLHKIYTKNIQRFAGFKFYTPKKKFKLPTFSVAVSNLKPGHKIPAVFQPVQQFFQFITFPFRFRFVNYFLILGIFFALITAISLDVYFYAFKDLPAPTEVSTKSPILSTKIYDRHGKELYSIFKDENRTLISLEDLPPHVIQATLAIEDAHFYEHAGFSLKGIVRAARNNLTQGKVHGGSTITQQLVKNTLLTSEKKFRRKIREVLLAVAVDALYSKEEILEMYFNQIAYGGSTYGIEEAAQRYFGKSAKQLTVAEAALLAGIPASPTAYSPFGNHPEWALNRQQEVLRRMAEEGYLTPEELTTTISTPISYVDNTFDIKAPHFVMYVRAQLEEMFGEQAVSQGGLEVYTTVDLKTQNQVQEIVSKEVDDLQKYRISNGAALVTNPKTGEILAMVGSTNYFDTQHDGQVNVTTQPRQPGSSIKPITYALALENGFTPTTKILDAPITYTVAGSPPYTPKNYDGKFHGQVTLRDALANSYNIPAVKLLATVGMNNFIDKAESMGITTWRNRQRFGLSLTLGGGEVYMTDMAKVYGTFANDGYTVPLNPIVLVKDSQGKTIYQNPCLNNIDKCPKKRSLDPRVAYQINNILSDNVARASAFGLNSVLHIPNQQVAVKTGTTNSQKDNWTIGYTSDRVVAVWVGNNDNTPMSYVASGITGASPIWQKVILTQLSENSPHAFATPPTLIKVAVCANTGTTCGNCAKKVDEYFIPGTEPDQSCANQAFDERIEHTQDFSI